MKILSFVFFLFGFVAFGLGIYMFIDRSVLGVLDPTIRTVLAIIFILYGIFRISSGIGVLRRKTAAK